MILARILITALALQAAAPASAQIDLRNADISHLPNGLTVIMLEDRSFPLVSVQMLYKSGSAAEVTGKTGLAHFLEHLAFRASQNFPNARATELIYDSGGEWHGYTAMDQTTYFATMPKNGLELLLKIEADRMARTVIDPASIAAEKGAVITELHGYENDPSSVLQEAVTRTAIQAHPYGSPMAGYVSDVERLTAEDASAYYASHYAPGNAVLTVVGDISMSDAKALVDRAFADVPARPVAEPTSVVEPPQAGERRTMMHGPVKQQYFQLTFGSAAASSQDFAALLVMQEILSGGSGLNLRQSDWTGTTAVEGSLLSGAADEIATWLPPTRDPFLFTISGSIAGNADRTALERDIASRIATLRARPPSDARLKAAKATAARAVQEDVQTTEDAAHQLAFFEGIGALESLLAMDARIAAVTADDVQRVARNYLAPERMTVGWMVPGRPGGSIGSGSPKPSADRAGISADGRAAGQPQLRILSAGLPAIVQASPLSDTVTVELLMSAPIAGGAHPEDLVGLDTVIRSGASQDLAKFVSEAVVASRKGRPKGEPRSDDPSIRLEQLIAAELDPGGKNSPQPVAAIVSGNVDSEAALGILERHLGDVTPGKIEAGTAREPSRPKSVRERIAKPLSQGALGYVVEGPPPGTREALVWRMLLYVLTHDYSGRLGRTAITENGIVYHIYSMLRTDGGRTWATISTGVDSGKADAMEAELRAQLDRLLRESPTAAETEAARNHLIGRDLTAAQSNVELTAKLARQLVETGALRSHEQLDAMLQTITPADLASAAKSFVNGMVIRVDVGDK